ncbi:MAG: AbrB/MazE/SpoVT family DNA-binding domain-containing protein [Asgard group archaeon]|nr:AbrB/MazE/SpoVT family DNA-binding domain-containing protein [Asgard group archaeon]
MSEEFKVKKRITYNGGVYRISIPKLIIDNMGLQKGEEVTIIYKDSKTLIITTEE